MSIEYDFDIFNILPESVRNYLSQEYEGLEDVFDRVIGDKDDPRNQIALFRDPKASEALKSSDPRLLEAFKKAGFGLANYHSGAPKGRFAKSDEPARTRIFETLIREIERLPSEVIYPQPFYVIKFLAHAKRARPIRDSAVPSKRREKSPRRFWPIVRLAILLAIIAGVLYYRSMG